MGCNSPFGQVAGTLETDETAGATKVLIDRDNERILGASIIPPRAATMAGAAETIPSGGGEQLTLVH